MRILFVLLFVCVSGIACAQFQTIGEYRFTSTAYYFGKPELLDLKALTEDYSEIEMVGNSSNYNSIRKSTEHDPYSYGFESASTDSNGKGIWIITNDDYNKGLKKVVFDPKARTIEFSFNDGTSQIFFNVKRVK